jgi:gliding motility-associated-like protein
MLIDPQPALLVMLMKLVNRFILLVGLWLGVGQVQAQIRCNPASSATLICPTQFSALDASNQEVTAFCVGQPVHFVPCAGRNVLASPPVYYGVTRGADTDYYPTCQPPNVAPYTFTPTAADVGMVTVSELATEPNNGNNNGGGSRYNTRNFRVYATPAPAFTIAPCPTGNVQVTLTDAAYDSYVLQVGTATLPITRNVPLTVPVTAGASAVTIIGRYTAIGTCTGSASQTINAIAPARAAQITSLTLQGPLPGGTATFALSGLQAGYRYSLQFQPATGGPFTDIPSVTITPATTTLALPNASAGRYRIFSDDACGTSPLASNVIGTLGLSGASANNRNQLLLSDAGTPGTTYSVTRNGPVITTTPISGGLEDANVQCGTAYTYIVTATQPGGGQSISNPVTITTVSALPPAQPRLFASFNLRDVVELTPLITTPTLPTGSILRYSRTAGSQPVVELGSATGLRILPDSTATLAALLASPPCYTVRLSDICGNTSPASPSTCPALLSAGPADPNGSTITLTWTPFTGPNPSQPATYILQRLAADGTVLSTVAVSGTSYTDLTPPDDRQVARYRLQISGAGLPAGTFSYSNRANVTRQLKLAIPTAFTPNGDGLNDVLEVKGKYLRDYIFVVVDRNGQEVFRGTQRSETWDGTIKGHAPVPGAYVWRFQQNNENGDAFSAVGAVTLLK